MGCPLIFTDHGDELGFSCCESFEGAKREMFGSHVTLDFDREGFPIVSSSAKVSWREAESRLPAACVDPRLLSILPDAGVYGSPRKVCSRRDLPENVKGWRAHVLPERPLSVTTTSMKFGWVAC